MILETLVGNEGLTALYRNTWICPFQSSTSVRYIQIVFILYIPHQHGSKHGLLKLKMPMYIIMIGLVDTLLEKNPLTKVYIFSLLKNKPSILLCKHTCITSIYYISCHCTLLETILLDWLILEITINHKKNSFQDTL